MKNTVNINDVLIGGNMLPIIAGPCVIESKDHALMIAETIKNIAEKLGIQYIYKSSFDKANRTSIDSPRGPGIEEGLRILQEVKTQIDVPIITDVHHPSQAKMVSEIVDMLQIPAFLCRQTDLIIATAETGKPVNIKKGQFLSPNKMKYTVEKAKQIGNDSIVLTERGSMYGYDNLIVDMRSIPIMQETGQPVIFDATHSAQSPGLSGKTTGGLREFIPTMTRSAIAAGCDGLFIEVHDDVEKALSDANTQWPLDQLENLLEQSKRIWDVIH